MTKVTPLGNNVILKVLEMEDMSKGGILLTAGSKEESVHGMVMAAPQFSYHPNGELRGESLVSEGDTVCFMKGSGTTVMEAPEGEKWLAVPEDCIHYKVDKS